MSRYTGVTNFQKTVRFWPTLYNRSEDCVRAIRYIYGRYRMLNGQRSNPSRTGVKIK